MILAPSATAARGGCPGLPSLDPGLLTGIAVDFTGDLPRRRRRVKRSRNILLQLFTNKIRKTLHFDLQNRLEKTAHEREGAAANLHWLAPD
ncbi:hypothetical protein EVAR_101791_1 [Eumeta japonica]|uniref:Uncharacterized protein n=1 Tax=Eumeta variegata TaxID=151549 RepID=A0A4C1SN65_EUMVA|nr:hypothetical protein EVAR_101791_1 [Eumeta japonica]